MSYPHYYPSNIVGNLIVNAVTGIPYKKCRIGKKKKKRFYRVIDISGIYNTKGIKTYGNNTNNKLFYDSYDQYINHKISLNYNTNTNNDII